MDNIECDRCGKTQTFEDWAETFGGNCLECEDCLCGDCGQWVGGICERCAEKLNICSEKEFENWYNEFKDNPIITS